MRLLTSGSAVATLGACLLITPVSTQAAPISAGPFTAVQKDSPQAAPLIEVRNGRRHWRRHHARHHWRHRHWGYYDDDAGAALAAGAIFGLAAGAIAANAAAGGNAVAYCSQRFRSYDPASGTYLGYDGYRHPCP